MRIRLPLSIVLLHINHDAQTDLQDGLHKFLWYVKTLDHVEVMFLISKATRINNSKDNYF